MQGKDPLGVVMAINKVGANEFSKEDEDVSIGDFHFLLQWSKYHQNVWYYLWIPIADCVVFIYYNYMYKCDSCDYVCKSNWPQQKPQYGK